MTGFGWAATCASAIAAAGGLWRAAGWLRHGLPIVPSSARERAGAAWTGLARSPRGKRAWRALSAEGVDAIVLPYFNLRWDAYAWPPGELARMRARADMARRLDLADPRFAIAEEPWFAVVRARRGPDAAPPGADRGPAAPAPAGEAGAAPPG